MYSYFAANTIEIDPEVNSFFAFIFIVLIAITIVVLIWQFGPSAYNRHKNKRAEKHANATNIWFDLEGPALHRGKYSMRIEPKSLHYFLCKFTFSKPEKYYKDGDILDEKDHVNENRRSMYHAVRNLNKKAKYELKLEQDLFIYSNNSTAISKYYRNKITKK